MAKILDNKKSTYGSPYCFYTVEYTSTSNRTATSVDIAFKVTSHLAYSSSFLGTGRTLKAQLYINGVWRAEQTLKSSSDSWSGASNHTKTFTLTISNLSASTTTLSEIKFKVKSSAGDQASGLDATSCSDITIPSGHQAPVLQSYTMQEALSGVDDNVIVEHLSIKQFKIYYSTYDSATISRVRIYSGDNYYTATGITYPAPNRLQFDMPFAQLDVKKIDNKAVIKIELTDSTGASSITSYDRYNYIPYILPTIDESQTIIKRYAETSGRVLITTKGKYYYGSVGSVSQSTGYKPTIKYKFWQASSSEPDTYDNTIPSSSISASSGIFTITNYDIGTETTSASNYFNPSKSYRVKMQITDNFKTTTMSEAKSVPVGEALWTEYKDRVDFKKLTIGGVEVTPMTTTTGTPTFTKTSGNGNITSASYVKYGKVVDLFIIFNTSGGSTSAGNNIWEGSLDNTDLYPKISEVDGVGYYSATHYIGNLNSSGTLVIRALDTVASNSNDHGLHIHYICE